MDRTLNHENCLKIISKNPDKNVLFENCKEVTEEVITFLNKKYPDAFEFESKEKVGIDFFTKKFQKNKNFTFIKYGDGELICMIGGKGKNCDDHPYSEKLSKLLEISFVKLIRHYKDVYLAEWTDNLINTRDSFISVNNLKPKFADYECFLTVEENLKNNKLINFYKLIKESKRKKIFVGPAKLKKVQQMLNIDKFVTVPLIDAFSKYEQILAQLNEDKIDNNNIYILCCSMMSCILCYDLKEKNPNITILDIGSGFDPIFGEKTRPLQTSPINAYNYYRQILPKSYIFERNKHARNSLNKMCSNY